MFLQYGMKRSSTSTSTHKKHRIAAASSTSGVFMIVPEDTMAVTKVLKQEVVYTWISFECCR